MSIEETNKEQEEARISDIESRLNKLETNDLKHLEEKIERITYVVNCALILGIISFFAALINTGVLLYLMFIVF